MDNIKRAKSLLKSARRLYEEDDLAGVAGLSYQAVESAIIYLSENINGKTSKGHGERRRRAEQLLNLSRNSLKELWSARNIDFYGNEKIDDAKKELSVKEIGRSLDKAEEIVSLVEEFLKKKKS